MVVESDSGFAAEVSAGDHFRQQRTGAKLRVVESLVQCLQHREAGVQSDEVGEFQRAHRMIHSEAHCEVYVFDAAEVFHARVKRLVEHRHEDAVCDEAGAVGGAGGCFAERAGERFGLGDGAFAGLRAGDDFHQRHERGGIHKMHADEVLRLREVRGEFGDGNGGGVRGEDGALAHIGAGVLEDGGFDVRVFGDGFNGEVGAGEPLSDFGLGGDALEGGVGFGFGDFAFVGETAEVLREGVNGAGELFGVGVVEFGAQPGHCANLRDSAAHLSGAENGNVFDRHCGCSFGV